jgi:hypothetical protein
MVCASLSVKAVVPSAQASSLKLLSKIESVLAVGDWR